MENLQTTQSADQSIELKSAVLLHNRVMADSRAAADAIVALAGDLKQMRDSGLYKALGVESFDEYCNVTAGIGARQGYNFIRVYEKLGEKYMAAHSELGITKLLEIVEVTPGEREQLAEDNDLAGMSVKEIKALIAEKQGLAEQLDLLSGQMESVKKEAALDQKEQEDANAAALRYKAECERRAETEQRLEGEIKHWKEELAAAKAAPVDAIATALPDDFEQQLANARAEAAEQAKAEAEKAVKAEMKQKLAEKLEKQEKAAAKAAEEAKAQLEAEKTAAIEQAKKEAAAAAEQAAREALAAAQAEQADAQLRAEELTKQLAVASSTEAVQFGIYFEQLQGCIENMEEIIEAMHQQDKAEQANKLNAAMKKLLQNKLEGLEE